MRMPHVICDPRVRFVPRVDLCLCLPASVWEREHRPQSILERTSTYDNRSPDFLDIFEDEDSGDVTFGR